MRSPTCRRRGRPGAWNSVRSIPLLLLVSLTHCACAAAPGRDTARLDDAGFVVLMQRVADGWNRNDAAYAASAFAENAIYSEPPDKQLYEGKQKIFEFFGGEDGRSHWMRMAWHHLSYNEAEQVGAGEFTFAYPGGQVHGMVSVKIEHGLIANWREYYYESDLDWDNFQGKNHFRLFSVVPKTAQQSRRRGGEWGRI